MRSTQNLVHSVSSDRLGGSLPYCFVDFFVRWHMSHHVTFLWTAFLIPGQEMFWQIIASVLSNHG